MLLFGWVLMTLNSKRPSSRVGWCWLYLWGEGWIHGYLENTDLPFVLGLCGGVVQLCFQVALLPDQII